MKTKLLGIMALCGAFLASTSATTVKNVPSVPSVNEDGFFFFNSFGGYYKKNGTNHQILCFGVQADVSYALARFMTSYDIDIYADSQASTTLIERKSGSDLESLMNCQGRYYTIIDIDSSGSKYSQNTTYYARAHISDSFGNYSSNTIMSATGNYTTEYKI